MHFLHSAWVPSRALSPQKTFGARVRELRQAAGMTQDDLAEHCGLFRTYLSRIENGQANPTLTMIHALAGSLGVPVPLLFQAGAPDGVGASARSGRSPPRAAPRPSRGRVR
ncbi:MAG: helix-turn-helix transcriptional regulator [Burkholderiales bacterium]|nr:helix-turn-helix transcriptional regulator [Burkholderiales bacterium]